MICQSGYRCVLSCSSSMKPNKLFSSLKEGLAVGNWRVVHHPQLRSVLVARHVKPHVYLFLFSNHVGAGRTLYCQTRKKYPFTQYLAPAPHIQKDYNKHKVYVDILNKMLVTYWRRPQYLSSKHAYLNFFVHISVHQAWVLSSFGKLQSKIGKVSQF